MSISKPGDQDEIITPSHSVSEGDILKAQKGSESAVSLVSEVLSQKNEDTKTIPFLKKMLKKPDEIPVQEEKELSQESFSKYSKIFLHAIDGKDIDMLPQSEEEIKTLMEQHMLDTVKNLPEDLSNDLGVSGSYEIDQRAQELIIDIKKETDLKKRSDLQIQLIFQYIALTSRVQNGGTSGFLPSLAKEIKGLDCSLSAWCLKEKLGTASFPDITFAFGNPPGHVVGIITIADGRTLYVDAQNGFIDEITLKQVYDDNNTDTAYPIYEIVDSERKVRNVPIIGETSVIRGGGSDYLPKYLGIQKSGLSQTIGNMHMLLNSNSPVYGTTTAKNFRDSFQYNNRTEVAGFEGFKDSLLGGKVIQETKFNKLSKMHHKRYLKNRRLSELKKDHKYVSYAFFKAIDPII